MQFQLQVLLFRFVLGSWSQNASRPLQRNFGLGSCGLGLGHSLVSVVFVFVSVVMVLVPRVKDVRLGLGIVLMLSLFSFFSPWRYDRH